MFLQAGPEIAVAASKTFVTQVTTLLVLAASIVCSVLRTRGPVSDACTVMPAVSLSRTSPTV